MAKQGSRIGRGVSAPLRRESGDFAMSEGIQLVQENCRQIVGVRGLRNEGKEGGEYPWRLRLGSSVDTLRHLNIRASSIDADVAKVLALDALQEWEPRATADLSDVSFGMARHGNNVRDIKITIGVTSDDDTPVADDSRVVIGEIAQ